MPLSKHYLDTNTESVSFDVDLLAATLRKSLKKVEFAYLMGSSRNGVVHPHSDLDIAVFLNDTTDRRRVYGHIVDTCEEEVPGVRCDLGILNSAEPIYRYEALKGHLLFYHDRETWLRFYSITCREYEHQLFHYEKQHRFRKKYAL